MAKEQRHFLDNLLSRWINLVQRFSVLVITLFVITTIASLLYTKNNLGMNTDTQDMLSPELPWRQLDREYDIQFPHNNDSILIVIESPTPDQAHDAAQLLYQKLVLENALYKTIYYPRAMSFFKQSALLFLDINELDNLSDNIASIQPFLAKLTEDQTIRGLFSMLGKALEANHEGDEIELTPILTQVNNAISAFNQQKHFQLSWQKLINNSNENRDIYREFITLQPKLDYGDLFPAEDVIHKIHRLANDLDLTINNNIRLRLTGSVILSHEELLSVGKGTGIAIVVSLCLVTAIMLVGLGSGWLVLAALITLITGLILTAGFATLTVGELNLISVVFAVLYIGLGVDFAIHLCLRYRELLTRGLDDHSALNKAAINTGGSLILCALTTAIGFYSFILTDYDGVAELGWISGSGMFISLFTTMTLLPALLNVIPHSIKYDVDKKKNNYFAEKLINFPIIYHKQIKIGALLITICSILLLPKIYFDHNTLNLQSPENESVQTYFDLLADSETSPWPGVILADNYQEAMALTDRLSHFSFVDKVIWFDDFIPDEQDKKLAIIEEMSLLLADLSNKGDDTKPTVQKQLSSINSFNDLLLSKPSTSLEIELGKNLDQFLEFTGVQSPENQYDIMDKLQHSLLGSLPGRLDALNDALDAELIEPGTIPIELSRHWVSPEQKYLIEIFPSENLADNQAIKRFVDQIQPVFPQVIGTPIVSIEAGNAVVEAFQQAFISALIVIILVLLLLFRNLRDTVLTITPLLMAALLTAATSILLNISLNFANIIALPLLLGIGVDSAIHIIHRVRSAPPKDGRLLATSSARAVLVSAITTIFCIGNLAFSPHLGTASMGKLLTIGISMTLICTLLVLPSLLSEQLNKTNSNG